MSSKSKGPLDTGSSSSNPSDIKRDAYAVLLPAVDTAEFTNESRAFFENGGVASLLGSSREEYVARRMNTARRRFETPELLQAYREMANKLADNVLVAIDYEIGGVHRLHDLAPQLRHPSAALTMTTEEIEDFGRNSALAARKLGVNFFLAPVIDVVTGINPWLDDRTLGTDPEVVGRIATAFIKGVQSVGVAATAKHFPGHHSAIVDPHDSTDVVVPGTFEDLAAGLQPYTKVIAAGVKAVMTGPIPVTAIDPWQPASASSVVVNLLRSEFKFKGLIVSDDLDLPGTLRGRPLNEVLIISLLAGVELILLASGPQVDDAANHIANAVKEGKLPRETLAAAAHKVRWLAKDVA
jgi:beta-N-acetylhexosaminidase